MRRRLSSVLVERVWYGDSSLYALLVPLSWLYAGITAARQRLYRSGRLRTLDAGCPVIVVGNLVSGGAGKTPVALWLAGSLKDKGLRPGIASRGYGGSVGGAPIEVLPEADPAQVGDEPLLMAKRLVCPVVVHPDRVAAARMLVAMGCDVVVADDGLQHYRLGRQLEIAVIDARRGFGNRRLLPAGPLREPLSRLRSVDRIMVQGRDEELQRGLPPGIPCTRFALVPGAVRDVREIRSAELEHWRGRQVHAVAGIGDPQRFFDMLEGRGIGVIPHPCTDHSAPSVRELSFDDGLDVLMTEKDAVKFRRRAPANFWYVPVELGLEEGEQAAWLDDLADRLAQQAERTQ
jgi:tetraacyldisaccharide 4'-kinase